MSIELILDEIIRRESPRYTNIAGDRGGPTKFGITLKTLSAYRGRACTAEDVKALKEPEAREIYRTQYVERPGFARVQNEHLKELLVDCGVNHGTDRAIRWAQAAVQVAVDGNLGRATSLALNTGPPREIFAKVLCTRLRFYEDLDDVPSQAKFDMGWTNRCCEFVMILAKGW